MYCKNCLTLSGSNYLCIYGRPDYSDAEQIIVARNENENISFKSGSLGEPRIRDEVCRILEGGKAAFRKRELRYDLSRKNGIVITSSRYLM